MFRCPKCCAVLSGNKCSCGFEVRESGRIKDFSSKRIYWNQVPREVMNDALASGKDTRAIASELFGDTSYMYRYIFEENRAKWKSLFNLSKATVVDIGCGWGALPVDLAKSAARVIACDSTLETLKFVEKRLAEDGIDNVDLICIDTLSEVNIPLADNSADLIVLNGVLEWVAKGTGKSPYQLQVAVTRELKRILRPGGMIVTAIENRYGFEYFCGHHDEHTFTHMEDDRLRYTTIMPRFLSNLLMKMKKGQPYDTYTYSYKGYKKLFAQAGLASTISFTLMPDYRFPSVFLPIDGRFYEKYSQVIERLLELSHKASSEKYRAENYPFILKKFVDGLHNYLTKNRSHRFYSHYFLFVSGANVDAKLDYGFCESILEPIVRNQ